MADWTIEQMLALPTCYDQEQYEGLWDGNGTLTELEICQHATPPASDRAQILSHMVDDAMLRHWAIDMLDGMAAPWPGHTSDLATAIALARDIANGTKDEATCHAAKHTYRHAPLAVKILFHERGRVAAHTEFRLGVKEGTNDGDALLAMMATRLGA